MITKKFFFQDKNYLLKEAQSNLMDELNSDLISLIRDLYLQQFNPLGIEDDFIVSLKNKQIKDHKFLQKPYEILSALYRYQYGDNQLEFIWDGTSQVSHYEQQWKAKYRDWLVEMCFKKPSFTRAIIKFTFNLDQELNSLFLEKYLCNHILDYFGFKLYKKEGLVAQSA